MSRRQGLENEEVGTGGQNAAKAKTGASQKVAILSDRAFETSGENEHI